jgi:NADH-quinone oxidoreductase subunit N
MLAGVVVATEKGLEALVFYLAAYTLMNLAIFAVVVARERETDRGDDIEALAGIGRSRPLLAWPLTIGMLALAGIPGTSGFMGKLFLIEATVDGDYTWLGVVIVAGSMVSLVYYLRVIGAVWMRPEPTGGPARPMPAIAGASPEAPPGPSSPERSIRGGGRCVLIFGSALLCGAATIAFGIAPSPLINWASHAANSLATTI